MGLTISSLFTQLFGKKQMRILMGKIDIFIDIFIAFKFDTYFPEKFLFSDTRKN